MLSAADFIAAKGYRCAAYLPARGECGVRSIGSAAEAEGCRAVVLPLPCTARDGSLFAAERYGRTDIGEIIARFGKGVLFIGGRLPFAGEGFADYFLSEALVAANAAATAEAAITLGMQCSGRTVCGTRYAVLGYGRTAIKAAAESMRASPPTNTISAFRVASVFIIYASPCAGVTAVSPEPAARPLRKATVRQSNRGLRQAGAPDRCGSVWRYPTAFRRAPDKRR